MLRWLKSVILGPQPSGPPETIRAFAPTEPTISRESVRVENQALVLETDAKRTVSLFEVQAPDAHKCLLTYRAKMKAEDLNGTAYLEMRCKFPKLGEHAAKGVDKAISGSTDWTEVETPVCLQEGQKPDLVKLNVVIEGAGKLLVKDVELLRTPIA